MFKSISKWLICVVLLVPYVWVEAAIPHKHSHEQRTGERLQDGSFRSRDADHHHGEGGEHDMEFDHEAILGSVKEAEEYHQLSPAQSKSRLHVLVQNQIDLNHDGFVDKHELKAHILRSFK